MIQRAKLENLKQIMALIKLNSGTFSKLEITEAKKDIEKLIIEESKENDYFVKRISGSIVGCAGFSKQNDTSGVYFLNWLAVHPDFKRRGIATELCAHVEGCINARLGRIILVNAGSGESNQYFYKKIGFKEAGSVPKYYSETKDLIWYYKFI